MSTVLIQTPNTFRSRSTARAASPARVGAEVRDDVRGVAAPAPHARLRITRRGRRVFLALVSVPLVVGALMFAMNAGGAAASGPAAHGHFDYVTVQSGESLWAIAEKVAPSADPREVIANIVSLNQLDGGVVTPGERIAIPLQYETPSN